MNQTLFMSDQESKKRNRQWVFFPFSLLVHGFVIAMVIVMPLLEAGTSLPPLKFQSVLMVAAPATPPPPPAAPAKRGGKTSSKAKEKDAQRVRPMNMGRLVAPVDIPEVIPDEGFDDFGFEGGLEYGVEGGVEGGQLDGVIGGLINNNSKNSAASEVHLSQVQTPKLLRKVAPQYPNAAIHARLQGVVVVEAVTDIYGRVVRTNVISGHPILRNAAVQAVSQWRYEPYILNGVPKPVVFTVSVTFSLVNSN